MINSYYNPVKILSGIDCSKQINDYVKNGKWLVVTSRSFTSQGFIRKLLDQFEDEIKFFIYDQVTPNPEIDKLIELTDRFRSYSFDGIIAIGGGSTLDTAKVLSVTLASEIKNPLIQNLKISKEQVWNKKIFLIAIPTTSGTGAEVTPFATLWEKENNKKFSVTGNLVYPDIAFLDPILTKTLPWQHTLYTGLDATSHALEALWNKNSSNISSLFSWESLKIIAEVLPLLESDLENIELRKKMQLASLMSGLAISQTRTAIAHGISYTITNQYDVPHGLACSFTLPYLIKENYHELSKQNHKTITKIINMLQSFSLKDEIKKYIKDDLANLSIDVKDNLRISNYTKNYDIKNIIINSL